MHGDHRGQAGQTGDRTAVNTQRALRLLREANEHFDVADPLATQCAHDR
nr:hypothetical protein [Actinoplanes solisilvae]